MPHACSLLGCVPVQTWTCRFLNCSDRFNASFLVAVESLRNMQCYHLDKNTPHMAHVLLLDNNLLNCSKMIRHICCSYMCNLHRKQQQHNFHKHTFTAVPTLNSLNIYRKLKITYKKVCNILTACHIGRSWSTWWINRSGILQHTKYICDFNDIQREIRT
jgi:hypothetical protein